MKKKKESYYLQAGIFWTEILFDTVEKCILPIWNAEHRQNSVIVYMIL